MSGKPSLESLQPVIRSMARRVAFKSYGRLQVDDLVQVGMLAVHTVLLRSSTLEEDHIRARASLAARNAMTDLVRVETRCRASEEVRNAHNTFSSSSDDEPENGVADQAPGPEEILLKRQMARLVVQAISDLPRRLQDVLRLSYEDGKTATELAELWGITPSRISQLHTEAIEALRQVLAPEERAPLGISTKAEMFAPDIVSGASSRLLV